MDAKFRHIVVERSGDVFCVRLKNSRLNDNDLQQLGEELNQLVTEHGCRLIALSMGDDKLDCLYSTFLGKLVGVRKLLSEKSGHIHLCEAGPMTLDVLQYTRLTSLFEIHPTMPAAVEALLKTG